MMIHLDLPVEQVPLCRCRVLHVQLGPDCKRSNVYAYNKRSHRTKFERVYVD